MYQFLLIFNIVWGTDQHRASLRCVNTVLVYSILYSMRLYWLQGLMRLLAAADDLDRTVAKKSSDEGLIGLTGWSIAWRCYIWSCRPGSGDWWRRVRSVVYWFFSEKMKEMVIMIPICNSAYKDLTERVANTVHRQQVQHWHYELIQFVVQSSHSLKWKLFDIHCKYNTSSLHMFCLPASYLVLYTPTTAGEMTYHSDISCKLFGLACIF